MTTSCLGGISNYDSTRANPQFVAGMDKIREVKGAMDIACKTTQTCKSLTVQLKNDYTNIFKPSNFFRRTLGDLMCDKYVTLPYTFEYCERDLKELQKLCNHGKNDLNQFEKNFVRQYSKIPTAQTATGNSNINWEMRQLSTLGSDFSQKAAPLAETAQKIVDEYMKYHKGHRQAVNLSSAVYHVGRVSRSI